METAKLFMNGQSQAVRLPKDYRFAGEEVGIKKIGDLVILFNKDNAWNSFINAGPITEDMSIAILEARQDTYPETQREEQWKT